MYLNHYNLEIKPFELSPDPKFIWLGEKHKEALAILKYGIREDKGFILLTGNIGTGKTTLISCLFNENDIDSIITSIPDPDLTIEDFFRLLSHESGIDIDYKTRGEFLLKFKYFLEHTFSDQKKILLIIDEAQRLDHQLLEQIRLLSTIEMRNLKLFSIILVGQNDLHECVMGAQKKGMPQKIAIHCHIEPLTKAETREYIDHRLKAAGTKKEIFSPEATSEIFLFSKGCPRLINTICDRALLTGYASGRNKIDRKMVQKCAEELELPGEKEYATETAREKPETATRKENTHEAAEERPVSEVRKEDRCEVAEGEAAPLTWGPGAEPKPLIVKANDQRLPSRDKQMPAPRMILVAAAILVLTAIALYFWLGA